MVVKVSKPEINVREKISELDKPSGTAGQAMLAAETPQEQFNLISAGRRNLIFNGDMRIAQRGTGAFTANGDRPVDRWQMISNTTDFTTTQDSTVPTGKGFTNSIKIQPTATKSPSSSTYARIGYSIEGYDGASLCWGTSGAKSATISFWVRASVTGIYSIGLKNAAANRSICLEYTIDSADTWEYKTITFPGVTDGTWEQTTSRFCYIDVWQAGQGSQTSTIGTWQGQNVNMSSNQVNLFTSTSNTFYITGFQMEVGKVATPFEHRSYGEELALCQRYYQKFPGALQIPGYQDGTTGINASLKLSPNMRAATPSTDTDGSVYIWRHNGYQSQNNPAIIVSTSTINGSSLTLSVNGWSGCVNGYVANLYISNLEIINEL
jgi:hypothetical protein